MKAITPLFIFLLLLTSCLKEELPVPVHVQGDLILSQVEIGNDYGLQIYYDLASNSIVKTNHKTDWDLSFECDPDGWHVLLNSSLAGAAADMGAVAFTSVVETTDAVWDWDLQTGHLDSTAIGDYRNLEHVYIIDRGYNEQGQLIGFKKIMLEYSLEGSYVMRVANLDGSEDHTVSIIKDNEVSFQAFSLESLTIVDIEPHKDTWDLLFTQYTHLFQDPVLPYLVVGVLLNRNYTSAVLDEIIPFEDITFEDLDNYELSNNLNTIGYDWKSYSFDLGQFSILSNLSYLVKTNSDAYFKLRFIDYYNDLGEKGAPKFELQSL